MVKVQVLKGGPEVEVADVTTNHPKHAPQSVHGRRGSSKGGSGSKKSDHPNGYAKNEKGQYVVPKKVAAEGKQLADEAQRADRESEWASRAYSDAKYHRLKREQKKAPELKKKADEKTKAYHAAQAKSQSFEKKNGLSIVDAYEAHTGRPWPHYRVDSRSDRTPKYVVEGS